jgi:hypothetical protein
MYTPPQQQVKTISPNGQVSLGKEFAGKMVLIDQIADGTWIIKCGTFIPDTEKWLYQASNIKKVERALDWADKTVPLDNFDDLLQGIEHDKNQD